jgi:hypothetical protein
MKRAPAGKIVRRTVDRHDAVIGVAAAASKQRSNDAAAERVSPNIQGLHGLLLAP